jgi:two-component SAPR family response regulator
VDLGGHRDVEADVDRVGLLVDVRKSQRTRHAVAAPLERGSVEGRLVELDVPVAVGRLRGHRAEHAHRAAVADDLEVEIRVRLRIRNAAEQTLGRQSGALDTHLAVAAHGRSQSRSRDPGRIPIATARPDLVGGRRYLGPDRRLPPDSRTPDEANRLSTTAHAGRGVAAVVGYPTGDRWRLHVEDDTVRVDPLGQTYARRNLTPTEQAAVADLVTAAKDLDGQPAELTTDLLLLNETFDDVPAPIEETIEPTLSADEETAGEELPAQVPEMKVLGTLRVEGIDGRFALRRCTELVAYLTFHRGGVEADTLMEALWPEQPPDYQRLNRHTYRARTTLGLDSDGEPYLAYVADGIYRISPHLPSDIEKFTGHIRQADRTSGADQAHQLRAALELVEGTPLTGAGNAYIWAHTDGIITHTIVAIDNAAHRLAQHALANDDPAEATWAARKGLVATGTCEQCYRNLMRAAAAEGNQVAFEAVYSELLAVVDADEGPDASSLLDPDTIELYEQESRRRRRRQAG